MLLNITRDTNLDVSQIDPRERGNVKEAILEFRNNGVIVFSEHMLKNFEQLTSTRKQIVSGAS